MDAETVALVERCFAEGKVERPGVDCDRVLTNDGSGWAYRRAGHWSIQEAAPESVIGWALVRACWAKGWRVGTVPPPPSDRYIVVEGIAIQADPIRAMAEALLA